MQKSPHRSCRWLTINSYSKRLQCSSPQYSSVYENHFYSGWQKMEYIVTYALDDGHDSSKRREKNKFSILNIVKHSSPRSKLSSYCIFQNHLYSMKGVFTVFSSFAEKCRMFDKTSSICIRETKRGHSPEMIHWVRTDGKKLTQVHVVPQKSRTCLEKAVAVHGPEDSCSSLKAPQKLGALWV